MVGHQRGDGGFDVTLQRDSVAKPWGFRLQGGKDSGVPLTIQRVFVGSSSDGRLQRGDVITAIDGYDVTQFEHRDAEALIQQSRNTLTITVQRGSGNSYADSTVSDLSYNNTASSWPASGPGSEQNVEEEDYSNRSVPERRQKFVAAPVNNHSSQRAGVIHMNPQPGMPSYVPKRPVIWQKKDAVGAGLMDPGWAPHMSGGSSRQQPAASSQQYRGGPARGGPQAQPVNRTPQHMSPPPATVTQERYEPPAWAGSLRRSGGVRLWEVEEGEMLARGGAPMTGRKHSSATAVSYSPAVLASHSGGDEPVVVHNPRLQTVKYGPGPGGPTYGQQDASRGGGDSARVEHLQYNSPIGLYSRANAKEALSSQTKGKAGQGTLEITGDGHGAIKAFDPARSDVFRLIAEEEQTKAMRQHGPPRSSSNSRSQPQHQPPQHRHDNGRRENVESQFADMGISDF